MNYNNLSNEELAELVKNKDELAFESLLCRFDKLINFKCRFYILNGFDENDFKQEAKISLYKAALGFNPDYGCLFSSYAATIIDLHLKNYSLGIIKLNRAFQSSIPYEELHSCDEPQCTKFAELPEKYTLIASMLNELNRLAEGILSENEFKALSLLSQGLSYVKIGDIMGISAKSVDNALQRARRKLTSLFDVDALLKLVQEVD